MPIDIVQIAGVMNLDDPNEVVGRGQHIYAKNLRFIGEKGNKQIQSALGNTLIPNSSLPAGTNQTIGAFYDQVKKRIIFFNWNSNGRNGVYQYSVQTQILSKLFLCFTDTATDILNFNRNNPIHSAVIIYRTEGDGDLLYWTDNLNKPRYFNMDTVATYSPNFTDSMINAAKIAPLAPASFPAVAGTNGAVGYFSDATVNSNLVKNKQFRFAYRWWFKNGEKSTFSPRSIVPLPYVVDPNLVVAQTTDNYIKVIVYSPDEEDYQAIEIFGQEWSGGEWGDMFSIVKLDRTDYNIPVNSSFTFSFYNDGSYIFIDPRESNLEFDWLPNLAETMELLNGNSLVYANITDGYDPLQRSDVDVQITATLTSITPVSPSPAIINIPPMFNWGSDQTFGLVYFDAQGKTNGVVSFVGDPVDTNDFAVTTPSYPGQINNTPITIPQVNASINHLPPSWAVSYQWVRVNLTPKFTQWVTMDYQTDTNYLYLCIQNLVEMNAKTGFLPTIGGASGDRVKILGKLTGDNDVTVFSTQQDYPILGVVQRTMTSPAVLGTFLKIPKPTSFPTPAYSSTMFIETYTPIPKVPDNEQLFYEWGQKYDIYTSGGVRYHRGQTQDQTGSQPALFAWTDGDVYLKTRAFYLAVPIENNITYSYLAMMDSNWNDYVATAGNSDARAWIIDDNAKQTTNTVQFRWGQFYQKDTNINGLNRFYQLDFDTVDLSKGAIWRLKVRDRIMRVFQDRAVGQVGIYTKYLQDSSDTNVVSTTNTIIATNNIQYYQGEYGLGGYPTSLVSANNVDYFSDCVRGLQLRLSGDGFTEISTLYLGEYTIKNYLTPYNQTVLRPDGTKAKIMGWYDYFWGDYVFVLQGGTANGNTYPSRTGTFNEPGNAYQNFYDIYPDWALCAESTNYQFLNGNLYIQNNNTKYCNYFGTQFYPSITLLFNDKVAIKKTYEALAYQGNQYWVSDTTGDILTSQPNPQTGLPQISQLKSVDYDIQEGLYYAALLRDANSMPDAREALMNGDYLKGVWIQIKLTYKGNDFAYLFAPYVNYNLSSRNL